MVILGMKLQHFCIVQHFLQKVNIMYGTLHIMYPNFFSSKHSDFSYRISVIKQLIPVINHIGSAVVVGANDVMLMCNLTEAFSTNFFTLASATSEGLLYGLLMYQPISLFRPLAYIGIY